MNGFVRAIENETLTENGMKTNTSSLKANVDLFFKIGAVKTEEDVKILFEKALTEDKDLAKRIMLYTRDIREGMGERDKFKWMFKQFMTTCFYSEKISILEALPELGYFKDLVYLYEVSSSDIKHGILKIFVEHLNNNNGLCAKWTPRKGAFFFNLANYMQLSPKGMRKLLVKLSSTVEQKMCANNWDNIEYSTVPSIAHNKYKNAFARHSAERYTQYIEDLKKGVTKINSSVLYPYDIVQPILNNLSMNDTNKNIAIQQWEALPNYMVKDLNILPIVDVSGSMQDMVRGNTTALDVAVSMGLYIADKNKSVFKDVVMTFSDNPKLYKVKGNIVEKVRQLSKADWNMSTNLEKAFIELLDFAKRNYIPKEDMPEYIIIFSDMEFNRGVRNNERAQTIIKDQYTEYGYNIPKIIYWNICSRTTENIPVRFDEKGTCLVSGFSPAALKAIFNVGEFNPVSVMKEAVMKERYNI